MKKNLKVVALMIIGLALTGSTYLLSTDISAGEDSAKVSAKDSTESKTASKGSDSTEQAPAGDTVTTESGLRYIVTREGKGEPAKKLQVVEVHYAGRLASNDKEFDNSYKRQRPYEFKLGMGSVIQGWDLGIVGMRVGEQRTLIIPSELGYGKSGHRSGKIGPDADLIFDLELVSIKATK